MEKLQDSCELPGDELVNRSRPESDEGQGYCHGKEDKPPKPGAAEQPQTGLKEFVELHVAKTLPSHGALRHVCLRSS